MVPGTIGTLERSSSQTENIFCATSINIRLGLSQKSQKSPRTESGLCVFDLRDQCPYLRDLSRSGVRDIFSTNNVQNDSSIWCVFLAYSCINLQFNFQQTQLHWNIYKHIFIVSCSLATMPAWQFVFLLSTTLKRIRESGQRNAQVFVTVFKAVSL